MSLLSVLFALIAESFISSLKEFRRFDVFFRYVSWAQEKLPHFSFQNGALALTIILASILFFIWLFDAMLGNVLGLFSFLFGIVILVFSIGPRDLDEDTQNIISALESKDYEAANHHASLLTGQSSSENPIQLVQTVKENVFLQANIRLLGVFFWFVLLGPIGAVLFRLSCLLKEKYVNETDEFSVACRDLYLILTWLPARICILSYAVAGNFVDTMSYWNGISDLWLRESDDFIIASGVGSILYEQRAENSDIDKDELDINGIQHALSLVKRAVIVWVVLLGILTVTGWLF